jgi:hypothetical protein
MIFTVLLFVYYFKLTPKFQVDLNLILCQSSGLKFCGQPLDPTWHGWPRVNQIDGQYLADGRNLTARTLKP